MSRLSFCFSSFGALINQLVNSDRKAIRDRVNLTNNSHPGMRDSDGHFQVGIA